MNNEKIKNEEIEKEAPKDDSSFNFMALAGAVGVLGAGALIFNSQKAAGDSQVGSSNDKSEIANKFTAKKKQSSFM